jgi:V/A-type H+-transporting ATPase subunit K
MSEAMVLLGWLGIYGSLVLAALGSIMGCTLAGKAAVGAMLDTEAGYGRYVGVAALPSSQTIYGIVITLTLNRAVTPENAGALFAIGALSGAALYFAALKQGDCCASAIIAIKEKPEVFGLSLAPAALVEGFAVFVFVFALVLSGTLPA